MNHAFIEAIKTLDIEDVDLSYKLNHYTSNSDYLDFSHKTKIQNWMKDYEKIKHFSTDRKG